MVKVSPDIYDGADPDGIDQEIRTELDSSIRLLEDKKTPVLLNFSYRIQGPRLKAPCN